MNNISRRRALILGGGVVLAGGAALGGAAGLANASGTETEAAKARQLVVVTANIGRKYPKHRESAIKAVRHAVKNPKAYARPLVGWQEIIEGDEYPGGKTDERERGWINKHFGSNYVNAFNDKAKAHRVPISVPTDYEIVEKRATFCHGPKKKVTPPRYITELLLQAKDDPKLQFVFVNTHYVAGAWNGTDDDSHEQWRRDSWRTHFRKQRDDVFAYWRKRGFPIVWTGDTNRKPMPKFFPKYEKRAFAKGIDQIGWIPGTNGTKLELVRTKIVKTHVEKIHDARVAIMRISRG